MSMEQLLSNAEEKISALKKLLGYDPTAAPERLLRDAGARAQIHEEATAELMLERWQSARDKYKGALRDLQNLAEQLERRKVEFLKEYEAGLKAIEKKSKELQSLGVEIDAALLPKKGEKQSDAGNSETTSDT